MIMHLSIDFRQYYYTLDFWLKKIHILWEHTKKYNNFSHFYSIIVYGFHKLLCTHCSSLSLSSYFVLFCPQNSYFIWDSRKKYILTENIQNTNEIIFEFSYSNGILDVLYSQFQWVYEFVVNLSEEWILEYIWCENCVHIHCVIP